MVAVTRIWRGAGSDHAVVQADDGKLYKIDVAGFSAAGWLSPSRPDAMRIPALVSDVQWDGEKSEPLPVHQIIDHHDGAATLWTNGGSIEVPLTVEEAATLADFARQQWPG